MARQYLLLLGLLTIMLAAMSLFSKGTAQPLGLTTYILGAMAGGYVFYLMHKYVYRFDRQGGDKSKRPGWLKRPPFYLVGCSCGLQFSLVQRCYHQ